MIGDALQRGPDLAAIGDGQFDIATFNRDLLRLVPSLAESLASAISHAFSAAHLVS